LRLFFAVDIPRHPALDALSIELGRMPKGLRPTDPLRQHITLKFLGDPPCPFEKVIMAASAIEGRFPDIVLSPLGFGAFPDWKRPSVLWIGLDKAEGLTSLASALDRSLNDVCGIALERRPFRAHLTTARVKDGSVLDVPMVRDLHSKALGGLVDHGYIVDVKELLLYDSTLTSRGPVYERLRTFRLGQDRDGE
jgi:2'-5' RNA ligase